MKHESTYAAFVVLKTEDGRFILVHDENEAPPEKLKLCGGSEEPEDKGLPQNTIVREVKEEIGITISIGFLSLAPIHWKQVGNNGHTVYFYRYSQKIDEKDIFDGPNNKSYIITATELENYLRSSRIAPNHDEAAAIFLAGYF